MLQRGAPSARAGSARSALRVWTWCSGTSDAAITGQPQHATHQAPTQEAPIDEIELAFEVLGLAPSAMQDEAKARFRALAKEWHPDRFTNDAPKLAEARVRMTQINVAYSVICEVRGW